MGQGPAEDIHQMVRIPRMHRAGTQLTAGCRLNSKLKTREVQIDDLITDLSDGVSSP
jgi:hypothetical protein